MWQKDNNGQPGLLARMGEGWRPCYVSHLPGGATIRVLARGCDPNDLLVVRNDRAPGPMDGTDGVSSAGYWYHRCWDDPALPGLGGVLRNYRQVKVLRYRPGKRITLLATDNQGAQVIIKCLRDARAQEAFENLAQLHRHRHELHFAISEPLYWLDDEFVLVQTHLRGQPLAQSQRRPVDLANAMGYATASLHDSRVVFPRSFGPREQSQRSARYIQRIRQRFPQLSMTLQTLAEALRRLANAGGKPTQPVHGSLHSKQWLDQGERLALVDFDRACMGHAELDVATYLAELDYEPGPLSEAAKEAFLDALPHMDERLLAFYRGHKHLAKAFNACKQCEGGRALTKTRRNLARGIDVVMDAL